jgi:hypothetical protein
VNLGPDQCISGVCKGTPIADHALINPSVTLDFSSLADAFFLALFGEAELVLGRVVQVTPTLEADIGLGVSEKCCEVQLQLVHALSVGVTGKGGVEAQITAASSSLWLRTLANRIPNASDRQTILNLFDTINISLKLSSTLSKGIIIKGDSCDGWTFNTSAFELGGTLSGGLTLPVLTSTTINNVTWDFNMGFTCSADASTFIDIVSLATLSPIDMALSVESLFSSGLPTFKTCHFKGITANLSLKLQDGTPITVTPFTTNSDDKSVEFKIQ